MFLKIENHAKKTARFIDYPGTMEMFLWVHSFGIYNIIRIKRGTYSFMDRFTGEIVDTVSVPGIREINAAIRSGYVYESNYKGE